MNGAQMTSWLGDQTEKIIVFIPYHGKDAINSISPNNNNNNN